jgi:predicted nucleotide-binding protein (sugar kinase/HSP70/actin superfamily)
MNYVCAAGTGSFIEEQGKRLSISLDDISDMADGQKVPYTSDRCTVYMERDLNVFLSEGWEKEQIITAVLYSVRDNYLSKVVGKSRMGDRIYFQGATARNKALVAVFENELRQKISVSEYCHLTGALGCAVSLIEKNLGKTRFSGMDFSYDTHTETCELCANQCELRVYTTTDNRTAWGLKCGRDYEDKKVKGKEKNASIENAFKQTFSASTLAPESAQMTVGLPETLFMKEYAGLFIDFFHRLGIKTIIEKSSDKKLSKGMEMINADFCAPMALSHGMVTSLAKRQVDFIFFPTIINEQSLVEKLPKEALFMEKMTDSYFCYYSSYAPAIIDNLPAFNFKTPIVSPKIKFNNISDNQMAKDLAASITSVLPCSSQEIEDTFILSRQAFYDACRNWKQKGKERLETSKDKMKILLLGRPYALFDPRVNLGIPKKLEDMGFDLISQSMLNLDIETITPEHIENMHWYFGQQILMAAQMAAQSKDIYPVFLTCFRCSPDAYLITYFKEIMEKSKKPYLVLQLDEHSSDVGYMTRIEAAADTFINDYSRFFKPLPESIRSLENLPLVQEPPGQIPPQKLQPGKIQQTVSDTEIFRIGDTILIPTTEDRINRFQKHQGDEL